MHGTHIYQSGSLSIFKEWKRTMMVKTFSRGGVGINKAIENVNSLLVEIMLGLFFS